MGNCQAVDAAALVIQHPDGKLQRLYWQTPASEVMKMNPGHYVTLIIPLTIPEQEKPGYYYPCATGDENTIRFTCVKLLRPTDLLILGRAYRLVTAQEVRKVLHEKKIAKMKKNKDQVADWATKDDGNSSQRKSFGHRGGSRTQMEKNNQDPNDGKGRGVAARSKSWRPMLQSISEAAT